ncbi:uncharacterized protein isoform X2 [Rhodnius prolixus]|uniref:uncharacterized protein isoform X2 n=1 Tax=Rhodnius prolixus TaxID=13249 RepID=UPI003D18EB6D
MPALELRATENKMKNDHLELQDTSPDSSSNGSFTGLSNSNGLEFAKNTYEASSFHKKLKVYPAKNRKPKKSCPHDFEDSHEAEPQITPRRADPTSRVEVMKNRPKLAYQRYTSLHPSGAKGELKLFYNYEDIKSDPNIFCTIPPEMIAEFEESKRIATAKVLEKLLSQSTSITFEDVIKNFLEDFNVIQERMAVMETLLKSETINLSKMDLLRKVSSSYEKINSAMENVVKYLKTTNKTEDEIQQFSKNIVEKPKEKLLLDPGDVLKNGTAENLKKDVQMKTFYEKYICTLGFTVDESKREIKAISVEQMNRITDSHFAVLNETKPSKMSLSSGSLADHSSLSESNSVQSLPKLPFLLQGRHSIPDSSSTSSASVHSRSRHSHQFAVPSTVVDRSLQYNRPKTCCCKCYCTLLKQNDLVSSSSRSVESLTACHEILSSSLENSSTKLEGITTKETVSYSKEEFVKGVSSTSSKGVFSEEILSIDLHNLSKTELNVFPEVLKNGSHAPTSSTPSKVELKEEEHQQNIEEPTTKDLLVFGCWINKYYPGKLVGVTEEMWNDSEDPFTVTFLDGTTKVLANVYIVPVSMIHAGIDIMCDVGNELFVEGTLVEIKKLSNKKNEESLHFVVKIKEEIKSFSFEKVWFYKLTIKQLGVTPRKPQVLQSGAPFAILEGKRLLRSQLKTPLRDPQESIKSTIKKTLKKTSSMTVEKRPAKSSLKQTRQKKNSDFEQGIKRKKVLASDEEYKTVKRSKLKKKLEFESQPSSSTAFTKNIEEKTCESKSSESEISDSSKFDYFEDSDLDAEFIPAAVTARKCLEPRKIKSAVKVTSQEEINIINTFGPIQKSTIFQGFNFILTHSDRTKIISKAFRAAKKDSMLLSSSNTENDESGSVTDFEEQLENCAPFDYMRLKMQIIGGGGVIYASVADVNTIEYSKTITISDYPCQTPNYLLSIALGIPIYRHDLIINCCKELVDL